MTTRGLVIVASTRTAAGEFTDSSGKLLANWLNEKGIATPDPVIVADKDIPAYISELAASPDKPRIILTTGGTGITPDDLTVTTVEKVLTAPMPGIAQAFWNEGLRNTPFAILSRAVAGLMGSSFIMTLPGSEGGCRDGITVLNPIIGAIVDMLSGDQITAHGHAAHHKAQEAPHGCQGHSTAPDPDYVIAQTGVVIDALMTTQPLEELKAEGLARTTTEAMGAVVTFDGIVRDHDGGVRVANLTYTAHPTAQDVLTEVTARVSAHHPKVRLWTAHRTGPLAIGESAFIVITAAAHRHDAFAAAEELSDAVKAEVPIWKEQELVDGSTQWVGLE